MAGCAHERLEPGVGRSRPPACRRPSPARPAGSAADRRRRRTGAELHSQGKKTQPLVTQPGHSTHRNPGILESTLRDRSWSCMPDHTDRFLVSLQFGSRSVRISCVSAAVSVWFKKIHRRTDKIHLKQLVQAERLKHTARLLYLQYPVHSELV